jgi:hypothetical protein
MKPRPKPLLGLLLGLLIGLVGVGLLWQLGVVPPTRFVVFSEIAFWIAVVELLLTQTTRRGKKRFVTSMVIAGVFAGVALTGIPETFLNTGSITEGCSLTVTSGTDEATPADTTATDPFDTTPSDTVSFTASTGSALTNWDSGLGMSIAGFPITLFTAQRDNAAGATDFSGQESVQKYLDELEDQTGLQLRGSYHAFGYIHADEGDCDANGFIRVNAESLFATPLIIGLWGALGLLVIIVIALTISVARSIRESKRYAAATASAAPGEQAATAAAPAAEPVGAFTPPEPERTEKTQDAPTPKRSGAAGAAAGSAAWMASRDDEPVAETQVMPAAETELLPVSEEPEPAPVDPPAADDAADDSDDEIGASDEEPEGEQKTP